MTLHIDNDRIEKQIHLKAPRSRVWRALTDHREFSQWFGVNLMTPFAPGETSSGHMTIPGYEHIRFDATVQKLEPESYFSYTWHPYAIEPDVDYSKESPTLVEFTLAESDGGTLLSVTESGFANIPAHRRAEAFRMNEGGWAQQLKDIEEHVTSAA